MALLLTGLAVGMLPALLKGVGGIFGKGRRVMYGAGGKRGMRWGYRTCSKCRSSHRCAGRHRTGKERRRGPAKKGKTRLASIVSILKRRAAAAAKG